MKSAKNIWFISEVYYPDEQGGAFYTTGLAEGLAQTYNVKVLCSCPTVTARGTSVEKIEIRNGVVIERCAGTTFNKDVLVLRLINILTYSVAILFKALIHIKRGDIVVAVTSPPSTPFIAKLVSLVRRTTYILRLDDVYPETLVATGMIKQTGFINRFFEQLNKRLYKSVDRAVVLGRDMKGLVEKKIGNGNHINIIENWSDVDVVIPQPKAQNHLLKELNLLNKFVVSCVGNMGRAQAIESIIEAATLLKNDERIHFLFIGSGAKKSWIEKEIIIRQLKNVTLLNHRPRKDQIDFLNACDISLISLLPGMTGAGVPSRMYNIMAAGKPIISFAAENCETSLVVREENIGWVVPPDNPERLANVILDALSNQHELQSMGRKARASAESKYSCEKILQRYKELIGELIAQGH